MRGPMGHGFSIPTGCQHLVLIALGETVNHLLPLIPQALGLGFSVAVCQHPMLPVLPAEIEIFPESILNEILPWADFLCLDVDINKVNIALHLQSEIDALGRKPKAQVLIHTPMPCGGLADCGICAVKTNRGTRLACKDGPVFDLNQLST
jgi:hypothetical protein